MGGDLLYKTIGDVLGDFVKTQPNRDCLVYADRDVRYSYKEFEEECNRVGRGLMSLGVKKGDHVAVWSTNYPQWVILQFALPKIGAALVTVNTAYRQYELEYLMRQSDSTTLFLMQNFRDIDYVETLYEVCPELKEATPGQLNSERLPFLKNVIFFGDEEYPGMMTWDEILTRGDEFPEELRAQREAEVKPDDICVLMYTSGTTGFPKGVMLTHFNLIADAQLIGDCMEFTPEDRLCIPVPFFHCFGCVLGTLATVTHGGTMVPVEQFNAMAVLEAIEKERCTAVHGVPTMFIAELQELEKKSYDLSSLRTGIMAGSPCPIEVMKAVIDKMGASEITIAYGLTEASPVFTMTRTDDPLELRVSTVGKALPQIEVKVINPENGEEVPDEVQGELCCRGFNVMKGYYKMPEATAEAIDKDGWLHSGDLGVRLRNGYYKITGRVKDMIIRGGENIYPREIEEFLYTHPKVLDVQVVGVPSAKYGEEVAACIRLKPEFQEATEEEFREYCMGKISRFKIPKYFRFVDAYPMTASGKIQKYKLRQRLVEELGLQKEEEIETA